MNKRVLVVEDEPSVARTLGKYLSQSGFEHDWIDNGLDVLPWLRSRSAGQLPDLIILDLMLPGCDGIDVYRQLQDFCHIPVIMATARVEKADRLLGLELGADDYVCKPYSPRELMARVKNILRRSGGAGVSLAAQEKTEPGLVIDSERMQASYGHQFLELTPAEFRLLDFLWRHQGQIFSRQQLLDQAYDDHRIVTERTVDTHVKNLRRKLLAVSGQSNAIKSVYGVGYKLDLNHMQNQPKLGLGG